MKGIFYKDEINQSSLPFVISLFYLGYEISQQHLSDFSQQAYSAPKMIEVYNE